MFWKNVGELPSARSGFGGANVGGVFHVAGGQEYHPWRIFTHWYTLGSSMWSLISDQWSMISDHWSALPPYKTDQVWMETMITWRKSFCGTLSLRTGLYCENVIFLNRRISKHFQMKKSNPNSGRSLERWWRGGGALRWPRWSTIPNQTTHNHNQILAIPNQTDLSHSKIFQVPLSAVLQFCLWLGFKQRIGNESFPYNINYDFRYYCCLP